MLKGLDPVSRSTLSEQVAKRLAARITAGDWQPGEKLPSEAELCKALNIGRSSLREALTSLAFIGLIRVRAGGGSYVAEQPSVYFTGQWLNSGLLSNENTLVEFVEARLILATELAGLCAERTTPEELAEMELLVERMKAAIHSTEEFCKLNLTFHLTMGRAAKNQVLNNILTSACEQTRELITKSLLLEDDLKIALRGLIKILETFRNRNPVKAREAMRHHLQSFQRGYKVLFDASLKTMAKPAAQAEKTQAEKNPLKVSQKAARARRARPAPAKSSAAGKKGKTLSDGRLASLRRPPAHPLAAMSTVLEPH
jgi:GntR family transcriptional repressor for pyruvate dehydrogenase complex